MRLAISQQGKQGLFSVFCYICSMIQLFLYVCAQQMFFMPTWSLVAQIMERASNIFLEPSEIFDKAENEADAVHHGSLHIN